MMAAGIALWSCDDDDENNKITTVEVTGVSLNTSSLSLNISDDSTLVATVTPVDASDQTVSWGSSNTSVATVDDDGTITAVSVGTATITVTTKSGAFQATCDITVTTPVSAITVSPGTLYLSLNETAEMIATVTPEDATDATVTWSSSNTDVVTVDENGTVTAIAAGTATITATAHDGSETQGTASVTVLAANQYTHTVDGVTETYALGSLTINTYDTYNRFALPSPSDAFDEVLSFIIPKGLMNQRFNIEDIAADAYAINWTITLYISAENYAASGSAGNLASFSSGTIHVQTSGTGTIYYTLTFSLTTTDGRTLIGSCTGS